jgi:hypothetical protein
MLPILPFQRGKVNTYGKKRFWVRKKKDHTREIETVGQTGKCSRAEKVFRRTTRKGEQNVSYICDLYPWVQSKPI